MAITAVPSSKPNNVSMVLNGILIWRIVLGLGSLGSLAWLWSADLGKQPDWLRWMGMIVLLLQAIASLAAVPLIWQRQHRGRVVSLIVDYLGFGFCLVALLQTTGVFIGIDSLAETFGRGLPYLLLIFVGYLVNALGDRYENYYAREQLFRRLGNVIMAAGSVLFLFMVGSVQGLQFWLSQLANPIALSLLAGTMLFGLAAWAMWRTPTADALGAQTGHEEMLNGWLFLSPNLLGFLIFFAGPLLISLYLSFTDADAFKAPGWVGLDNYARIFNLTIKPLASPDQLASEVIDVKVFDEVGRLKLGNGGVVFGAADKLFWLSLRNTLLFTLLAVPLSVIPALLLANILNSKLPGMKIYRAIYFLPSIAAVVGIALVWQWLYNATIGYINYGITLSIEFFNRLPGVTLEDPQVRWLSDSQTALLALVIVSAWQTMGFNTVLFLAGLQNIPSVLYEAATVDGAGRWAKFWNVTLPLLAPTTFFVITTTTIQAMQVFEQVFILTNPPGAPNNSTLTLVLYLYQNGFQFFKQGYASAIAWVLFIAIFGVTLFQFQRQRATSSGLYDE